jgi:D-glycero-D-manno-heptose 1,7-bisphosphate phosphatase
MNGASGAGKIVVLDRDGTIVVDRGYLADPAGLAFLPGAPEGLRWIQRQGYRLIVITNQSAVARGLLSAAGLEQMHVRLHAMLAAAGVRIERIYSCPHVPEDHCDCRKPGTALLLQAAKDWRFDPSQAIVIGDKASDVELGRRVGATTVLITGNRDQGSLPASADYVVSDLVQAARAIERRELGLSGAVSFTA